MTTLFTVRRRAEEFAAAVDGDAGSTGARHAEVTRLVGVAGALRAHPHAVPRPAFADDLRARLMTEAGHLETAGNRGPALPVRVRGGRERRLVAAACAVVLVGGTAGVAAAAQGALPGEALYPVKRGIERAEAGLSMSRAGKGQDLLDQATDRLNEVEGLLGEDSARSAPQVPGTLGEFSLQATEGADLLLASFRDSRDPSSVVQVRTFAAEGMGLLGQLADHVAPGARDELATAAVTLHDIDRRAAAACDTCTPGMPDLTIPGVILAGGGVDRAMVLVPSAGDGGSHPLVDPEGTASGDPAREPAGGSPGGESSQPAGPAPASDPTDVAEVPSTDGLDPDALPTVGLPGTDPTVSGGGEEPVEDLADGLSGAVETLLP